MLMFIKKMCIQAYNTLESVLSCKIRDVHLTLSIGVASSSIGDELLLP